MYGALDADAASYYPSTKMGMNMDPMSLLGKVIINNDSFRSGRCLNHSFNQNYIWYDSKKRPHEEDLTGPIVNSYKNKNESSLMYNWFGELSIPDICKAVDARLGIC